MHFHKSLFGTQLLIPTVILLGLTALSPRAANAQFAVFDGTNWAMMGKIWGEDVSTGVKMSQELAQGLKLYTNAVQIYGLASQEASYLKNKQILLAVGFLAQHAVIPGHPEWDKALTATSGMAGAAAAWQQMTAPGGRNSFQAMNSRIQLADSFGASVLNAVGSCSAAAAQTNGSIAALEQMGISLNQGANTRARPSQSRQHGPDATATDSAVPAEHPNPAGEVTHAASAGATRSGSGHLQHAGGRRRHAL